ncbi:hypothetical protein BV898_03092 [Hypsibius exemplaris]|uniref:Uncharacterized protein n=1 Tax=Hypsibius exemplaris TaxID=2072580 RepID=A0A1W0X6L9_HYPEX|nr:hypothetical protein BV898_03092 [Hypsibius exemplaris]
MLNWLVELAPNVTGLHLLRMRNEDATSSDTCTGLIHAVLFEAAVSEERLERMQREDANSAYPHEWKLLTVTEYMDYTRDKNFALTELSSSTRQLFTTPTQRV